jgi:hypothetical protein
MNTQLAVIHHPQPCKVLMGAGADSEARDILNWRVKNFEEGEFQPNVSK